MPRLPQIESHLKSLSSLEALKKLLWQELNYDAANAPATAGDLPAEVKKLIADGPTIVATGGKGGSFHVVLTVLKGQLLPRSAERTLFDRLTKTHPYALFIFANESYSHWHFVNIKLQDDEKRRRVLRRISVGPHIGLRTAIERLQMLDLASIADGLFGVKELSALQIQKRHDNAFDVESVTKEFYQEIANWYFWAREVAKFPKDAPLDSEGKPSLHVIRLITRLLFCWFLKEKRLPSTASSVSRSDHNEGNARSVDTLTREAVAAAAPAANAARNISEMAPGDSGLIPDQLFDPKAIAKLLRDPSPKATTYYTAVLQNLFFATLNTEMGPGALGDARAKDSGVGRRFVDEGDGKTSDDHMVHTYWRHQDQLTDPEALATLLRQVPFLNGGLFECLDDRLPGPGGKGTVEKRIDGFSTKAEKQPKIPNFLFFGRPQDNVDLSEAYGDSGRSHETVRPILEIFNRYNFTLTENTPLDQEVALDPELLGHVFENLLAAYNPETGTVARKATGSFYTPRVVVDWMVDQALVSYLANALGITEAGRRDTEERLKRLLSWEDPDHEFTPKEADRLIEAVDRLKALDPACGSGAFPMGMLQKLVLVLRKIDPKNDRWRRRQEKSAEAIESSPARDEARRAIERAFAKDNDDFGRKLYLIENCLYGVDIQPIACQIAKLRFFISLIVDQAIDPTQPNYGILALPNLETKIVAANSLLGLQRGQLSLESQKVKELEGKLRRVRHDYFTARSYARKKELRQSDRALSMELAEALKDSGEATPADSKRLAGWNPYDLNASADFFDPAWMFAIEPDEGSPGAFHIVIGNPPYVRQEELKSVLVRGSDGKEHPLKEVLKQQYECYTGTADLYVYFFERSFQLMKKDGVLSFVTSNKYFRANYGERLRMYLYYATRPLVVIDFGDAPVFTSIAYPCIIVAEKRRTIEKGELPRPSEERKLEEEGWYKKIETEKWFQDWQARVMTWEPGPPIDEFPRIFDERAHTMAHKELKPDGWRLESPANLRLLERIRSAGTPLGEYVKGRFYYGIKTGLNEAFVVDRSTRDRLIKEHASSKEVLKPFLRGRDVKRWRVEFADQYLIKIESSENVQHPWSGKSEADAEKLFARSFPAIHQHFRSLREIKLEKPDARGCKNVFEQLQRRDDQGKYFWELRSCKYWNAFEKDKIIYPNICSRNEFAWDSNKYYANQKTFIIPGASPYLLAVLNSSVTEWLFPKVLSPLQNGYFEPSSIFMETFPIPCATTDHMEVIGRLAFMLVDVSENEKLEPGVVSRMIQQLESWLNGLVYELFFDEELHAKKLFLLKATGNINLPDLKKMKGEERQDAIKELVENVFNAKSAIRSMLEDLKNVEMVRRVEEGVG